MKKRKVSVTTIILIIILLAGLSLLLYPTVSDWWNSFHQSRAISDYTAQVDAMSDADYEAMLQRAREYNASLWTKSNRYYPSEAEMAEYESLLDVTGNGMMSYIEIPSINVSLPIYHGIDESVLQVGVGHIVGTSLPVGGEGTHCVISAHRGLPSAKLFSNLDKMKEGDLFVLRTLHETLTYEVDQIRIVLPDEMDELDLVEGEDYCTLLTCTPYGINTHRLLVRGRRTANQEGARVDEDAVQIHAYTVALYMAVPILGVLFIWILLKGRRNKKGGA